uniref:Uncharacterized protein n=1 Tax=Caenorhabditis japonica TaxID=281687 RepID=A0A8R1E184_CAEJA
MERAEKWKEWEAAVDEKPEIESLCKEKRVEINAKTIIVPPVVLETTMEIFFDEQLNPDSFDPSLPKLLHKVVANVLSHRYPKNALSENAFRRRRLHYSWLHAQARASLLGSLRETIERKSLTLDDFKTGKLAADWTDMIIKAR